MSGNGTPTTGSSPVTIPTLTRIWVARSAVAPSATKTPDRLPGRGRDVEAPREEDGVAGEQRDTADKPPHLGEYGEDKIRVTLREKGQPALGGAGHSLAQELTRSDRDLRLDHVVGAPQRVAHGIQVTP